VPVSRIPYQNISCLNIRGKIIFLRRLFSHNRIRKILISSLALNGIINNRPDHILEAGIRFWLSRVVSIDHDADADQENG
jgi:hypothetical protein